MFRFAVGRNINAGRCRLVLKRQSWWLVSSVSLEFINGIRTVQAFAAQDFERRRFYDASAQLLKATLYQLHRTSQKGRLPQCSLRFWHSPSPEWTVAVSFIADIFICLIADHADCTSSQWSQSTVEQFSGADKELLRTDNKTYKMGTSSFPDCSELSSG